jgi:hypothetical protein
MYLNRERNLQISNQPYELEELIECQVSEVTNEDPDEFISNDNDVAIQTALNRKNLTEVMKMQGMLIDEMVACDLVKAIGLEFKMRV